MKKFLLYKVGWPWKEWLMWSKLTEIDQNPKTCHRELKHLQHMLMTELIYPGVLRAPRQTRRAQRHKPVTSAFERPHSGRWPWTPGTPVWWVLSQPRLYQTLSQKQKRNRPARWLSSLMLPSRMTWVQYPGPAHTLSPSSTHTHTHR